MMTLYTIGFTKKSAREFFTLLKSANVATLIDVRLNATSQLAGFAKRRDLEYFLEEICNCGYRHLPFFAPTKDILDDYHHKKITWQEYELQFQNLLQERNIGSLFSVHDINNACLLCAEPKPEKCHRRLVAEKIQMMFPDVTICHL